MWSRWVTRLLSLQSRTGRIRHHHLHSGYRAQHQRQKRSSAKFYNYNRAFSLLKAATTAFTFSNVLRHYAKHGPPSINYDICVSNLIPHMYIMWKRQQALVGAFSVIKKLQTSRRRRVVSSSNQHPASPRRGQQTSSHLISHPHHDHGDKERSARRGHYP